MPRDKQDGLAWEENLFGPVPRWTREPAIAAMESVCRQHLNAALTDPCDVSFYAAGAFNKLVLVVYGDRSLLMRVTLPVHPHDKTRGEVATLRWACENTKVPVPKVVAFEDSNDNEIGFEWILMELMAGCSANSRWRTMSMEQKVEMTTRLAEIQADLFRHGRHDSTFQNLGTLDLKTREEIPEGFPTTAIPGQLVSAEFFMGDHLQYDIPRGPFRSSFDWLSSELNIIIREQTLAIEKAEDEDDREDAEEIQVAAQRLLSILPKFFSSPHECAEATVLYHDDLNLNNILVDDEGKITAVVDWECVSALPLWMTTRMPKFLTEESREDEPKRDEYKDESPLESATPRNDGDLDNEGKDQLYWIHLMEYEVTQLRKVYSSRMGELWPDWPLEESYLQVDFFEALLQCSAGFFLNKVNAWVDGIERGDHIRWTDA
ncbi:hypothetical protein SCUP515_04816 [Seiridium cupressi]